MKKTILFLSTLLSLNCSASLIDKRYIEPFTKADVGLGNVDNTSDANKPISSATQTALNTKASSAIMVGDSGSGGAAGLVPAPATGDATKFLRGDGTWQTASGGGGAVDSVFGRTGDVVAAPGDYTKSDVGLGNVDNTSDATKNAAVATLTNKTLTSPVINTPTGIVKGDVGLGNVDNTSDSTKNSASATLTNKTIDADSNTISNIENADIKAAAAIAHTKLANITAGSVLMGNASNAPTATALSGDVTVNSSGVTAIGSGVVVNADINASAAIAYSKLASLSTGQVLLGNAGTPTATALSGGATVGATGVVTLGNTAVTGQALTGFSSSAGTVSATDTILQGFNKVTGNITANTTLINNHTSAASDAHDASAISVIITGPISDDNVQDALATIAQAASDAAGDAGTALDAATNAQAAAEQAVLDAAAAMDAVNNEAAAREADDASLLDLIDTKQNGTKGDIASRPTCDEDARGNIYVVFSDTGVDDEFQVCMKDAADAYDWVTK